MRALSGRTSQVGRPPGSDWRAAPAGADSSGSGHRSGQRPLQAGHSLAQLRLIDEVERAFDIDIDFPEDASDLRSLAVCLRRHGVQGPP